MNPKFNTICSLLCVVLLSACYESEDLNTEFLDVEIQPVSARLKQVAGCGELAEAYRQQLIREEQVHAYNEWHSYQYHDVSIFWEDNVTAVAEVADAEPANEFSETNVQEAGVDEADLAKTDGNELFVVSGNKLARFDVTVAGAPQKTGAVSLDFEATGLYFTDSRLVVMGLYSVNFYDRESLERVNRLSLQTAERLYPQFVDSRRIDGKLYVTASVYMELNRDFFSDHIDDDSYDDDEDDYKQAYRSAVSKAYLKNKRRIEKLQQHELLPQLATGDDGDVAGDLDCRGFYAPESGGSAGLAMVLTMDIAEPKNFTADGVLLNTRLLYLNEDALYIAGNDEPYFDWAADETEQTAVYRFDITEDGLSPPVGAIIPGFILNPYSMSHYEGNLRVATTQDRWWNQSNNMFILGKGEAELTRLGEIRKIAPSERIYSARFYDDWGYVVTFREVDPLYVFDLSDPTNPKITGELKIPGFATHIQRLDDNRLLTIGQADEWGMQQLQIINIADKANPYREDVYSLGYGWSEAYYQPHAFLYYEPLELLVVPTEDYYAESFTNQYEAFTFAGDENLSFDHLKTIRFSGSYTNRALRSVIIGDYLYGIGALSLSVYQADMNNFALVTSVNY